MALRTFPKSGYYRTKQELAEYVNMQDIILCTSTTKNNMYNKKLSGNEWGWCRLCWMSVPSKKSIEEEFDFFEEDPGFSI